MPSNTASILPNHYLDFISTLLTVSSAYSGGEQDDNFIMITAPDPAEVDADTYDTLYMSPTSEELLEEDYTLILQGVIQYA